MTRSRDCLHPVLGFSAYHGGGCREDEDVSWVADGHLPQQTFLVSPKNVVEGGEMFHVGLVET